MYTHNCCDMFFRYTKKNRKIGSVPIVFEHNIVLFCGFPPSLCLSLTLSLSLSLSISLFLFLLSDRLPL